jgi:hypothetical protein
MRWDVVSEGTGWDEYIHPFVNSDSKPEPSYYPALAAFDIKVDRKSKFPVLLLAIATVCQTIANARLRSELTKGCRGPEPVWAPFPHASTMPSIFYVDHDAPSRASEPAFNIFPEKLTLTLR